MRYRYLLLTCAFAVACDPMAGVQVQTRFAPSPEQPCIRSVVTQSTLLDRVDTIVRSGSERRWPVHLYNASFKSIKELGPAAVSLGSLPGDSSSVLTVLFSWPGRLAGYPDSVRRAAARHGNELLRELQSACGRPPSTPIECEEYEFIWTRRACDPGAT